MGFQSSSLSSPPTIAPLSSHNYSHQHQLKLYQAFIFSVPALFTIVLFLLFYVFYLKGKRRSSELLTSHLPSSTLPLSNTSYHQRPIPLVSLVDLKEELSKKLQTIMFDEELTANDPQCCVCLRDFEVKEQLHQIPECKHVFHLECIHSWLRSNTTCPLCRCSIICSYHWK